MASVKNLKKDINYILGDIIEECYVWQLMNPDKDTKKSEKIVDDTIKAFDVLIEKVNKKDIEDSKKHFKSINKELESTAVKLIEKVNKL